MSASDSGLSSVFQQAATPDSQPSTPQPQSDGVSSVFQQALQPDKSSSAQPQQQPGLLSRAATAVGDFNEAVGKGLGTIEKQRFGRQHRHAEAEDRRFPPAHPLAINRGPHPIGREDLRDLPRDAGEGDRRHRVPPDGHRRQRAARRLAGRRHRHARPPRRPCRACDRRFAQEVRPGRGDPRNCLRWTGEGGMNANTRMEDQRARGKRGPLVLQ